jgi:hypothetical protein
MAGGTMSNWSQRPDALERDFEFKDLPRIDEVTGG